MVLLVLVGVSAGAQGPVTSGAAAGTFSVDARNYKLTHSAAFMNKDKQLVLLLTDLPVPAGVLNGTDTVNFSQMMGKAPFSGVVLYLDEKRTIVRADVYEKSDQTSTSGLFALKFDSPAGKTLTGTASATAAAAKVTHPIKLDVTFNATAK